MWINTLAGRGRAWAARRLPRDRWPALAAVLAAAFFCAQPLTSHRFHPDEALYAWFARLIAAGRDILLAGLTVDKPPLSFYVGAASMLGLGGNEFAARLPAYFASVVSAALVFALGRRLYGARAGVLAGLLFALSPFTILFAVTVFIDPLLTAFVLWGLWLAAAGRPRWMAAAFTLAFATKQTAVLLVPLGLAFSLLPLPPRADWRAAVGALWAGLRWLVPGLVLVIVLTVAWDKVRQAPIGMWDQATSDNAPNRLIRSGEVLPRAQAWAELLSYGTGAPAVNGLLVAGWPVLLGLSFRRRSRAALADWLITGYVTGYLAVYWLSAINVWDRYLVPIIPLILLIAARVIGGLADGIWYVGTHWPRPRPPAISHQPFANPPSVIRQLLPALTCLLLLPPALTAARSGYPIGGDHGAYLGIDETARYIQTLPAGTVLYDFWLTWEWNFYLFDSPAYVAWMPSPADLTRDLQSFGRKSPRYLTVPSWESGAEAEAAVRAAGFHWETAFTARRPDGSAAFVVYHLLPDQP